MQMKYFLLLSLFLAGCDSEVDSIDMYKLAKLENGKSFVCYNITSPEEIAGRYCTKYKGKSTE